jgi:glutamate 5-kinase
MSVLNSQRLNDARRIVIKVGSALLVDESGGLNRPWLESLCKDVAQLRGRDAQVVVVSSGAIALGAAHLGLGSGRARLEDSQAAAAVGQIQLAHAYQEALSDFGVGVAQVLLSLDDSESRRRYLNARGTLTTLLKQGVVPIVNENDTVATAEIRYGDNDRLAARVAEMVSADVLVLLSDVDGLYSADPQQDPTAEHVAEVHQVSNAIRAMASGNASRLGSGGMRTKLDAATIALAAGCSMAITRGDVHSPIAALCSGARATWFLAEASPRSARKQWIGGTLQPRGSLHVDAGAYQALKGGSSLLPAGVVVIDGHFERGDAVRVLFDDVEIARGLVAYPAVEAAKIAGRRSADIAELLGYCGRDEMIHRDDLVFAHVKDASE